MKAKKILIVFIIIMSLSLVLQINKVQAALQANEDNPAKKARNTWMTEVRQMESLGGTLGLKETQNADLTSSSGSNNLDIHMQKNTEYGAMALLSASAYGKPTKIENGETTTGNETGVVIPYNNEWTAAQYTDFANVLGLPKGAQRYWDSYNLKDATNKAGDALLETRGWHSTKNAYAYDQQQFSGYYNHYKPGGIIRNMNGIFGFNNNSGLWMNNPWHLSSNQDKMQRVDLTWNYPTRAVIVNGEGI